MFYWSLFSSSFLQHCYKDNYFSFWLNFIPNNSTETLKLTYQMWILFISSKNHITLYSNQWSVIDTLIYLLIFCVHVELLFYPVSKYIYFWKFLKLIFFFFRHNYLWTLKMDYKLNYLTLMRSKLIFTYKVTKSNWDY